MLKSFEGPGCVGAFVIFLIVVETVLLTDNPSPNPGRVGPEKLKDMRGVTCRELGNWDTDVISHQKHCSSTSVLGIVINLKGI